MVNPQEWLEIGQKFHGHKCPAMPNGLKISFYQNSNIKKLLTFLD